MKNKNHKIHRMERAASLRGKQKGMGMDGNIELEGTLEEYLDVVS